MTSVETLKQNRVLTAEALALSFNRAGLRYVLVNGLYGYPAGVGRDLDILIRPEDAPEAIAQADRIRELFCWDLLLLRRSPYGVWQLFLVREEPAKLSWLEVDLMHGDSMLLGAASLVDDFERMIDSPDYYLGPFPVSKVGQYIKAQLRPILYGDSIRFEKKYALEPVEDEAIGKHLRWLMGPGVAKQYCRATHAGPQGVRHLGRKLKWAINRRLFLRHPLSALRNGLWSRVVRPASLYLFSAGLVFAVVGPDYGGKKAALEEAVCYLNGCFETRTKEFDSSLLSSIRSRTGQHRVGWFRHWVRLFRIFTSLTWRYFAKDRFLPKSVIQFALYDGSVLNLLVDPARYHLRSSIGVQLLSLLVPRSIEILLVDDHPESIRSRNGHETTEGSDPELNRWLALVSDGQVKNVVTAGDSPAETGRRLASCMLRELHHRFSLAGSEALSDARLKYSLTKLV